MLIIVRFLTTHVTYVLLLIEYNVCDETYCNITLWLFNIAMDNGPFIDDFPSYKPRFIRDFPWLC